MMQGRAKKESIYVTKEVVYVGVDIAKDTLDVAVSNSQKTCQFTNDYDGMVKLALIILPLSRQSLSIFSTSRL